MNWNKGFERLVETRTELINMASGSPPWGDAILVESSIELKKRWYDCWDGMPTAMATASYSSSDFVTGQSPIRIFESVEMSNVRVAGSLDDDDDYEYIIADVNVKSNEADFSTLTFDLTGLGW